MMTTTPVGIVADLWRFPVKSMRGERLNEADVTAGGVLGDRAYALLDSETGAVVSASNAKFPGLLDCHAAFLELPRAGGDLPPVRITLPGGASAVSDSSALSALLSSHFRRDVALVRSVPESYASTQSAFFSRHGLELTHPAASFVDLCAISVISSATLARFSQSRPRSRFDQRRFRINIIVETDASGFIDNEWIGHRLMLGAPARIAVRMPDPRCVMMTLPQDELPKDPGILRAVAELSSLPVGNGGRLPCAGVYATVDTPGLIRRGDSVLLAEHAHTPA